MSTQTAGGQRQRVLLLGHRGKLGLALGAALGERYTVVGRSSGDFDAFDGEQVRKLVEAERPDVVINAVAFQGIDAAEQEPGRAMQVNALHPKLLAELSRRDGFLLVHFSSDAVFGDSDGRAYVESDCPRPPNIYGLTKFGGDGFIQTIATRYYIFRMPVMFGEAVKERQFVEKMLAKCREGAREISAASDIVSSPTYSRDAAAAVAGMVGSGAASGLYHLANEGKASLYDLMKAVTEGLGLEVKVKAASYKDFPHVGIKNTCTPLRSEKIAALRPWKEAVREYCARMS
jgi:dTDP-4-dehydrorhamnose reductase